MSGEIQYRHIYTGKTLYATIRNSSGQQWNTAGTPNFESVTAANWADYDVALAESSGNYFYTGTFPAISGNMVAGWYWVDIYERAGASPAITDEFLGTLVGYWNGTLFAPWASNVLQVAGTVQTAGDIYAQFTGDTSITLAKVLEMFAAFMAGKVSVSSAGGVSTYTYKKRDGSTTSFTAACSETDGTRATTGSLS